ncbi:PREDICTED: protein ABA DEFICIENT 4, chloroplastic-like isoform X1 [Nicotiana attenuata]|uniref:Protein aba deficient 4, chloroplastic n=1 Tax=Nicotiana attenuata TaxID=49451 RepID=A0A1J6I663_NICAT|nr:PREDICTED: protein ABA DEFICIENT 4, chloroplastic-like isoform X1 [Nicotiana attenuata]OIT00010.1 protein aba deficient 4, chloroplastic [Nicotiana attenuata]
MAISSSCFCHLFISPKLQTNCRVSALASNIYTKRNNAASFALGPVKSDVSRQKVEELRSKLSTGWSFLGGSRIVIRPNVTRNLLQRKSSRVSASWFSTSEIAATAFPLGSLSVLPFYVFMVVAPKAEFTHKVMESKLPYIVLGRLYAYILVLSWRPDTLQLLFHYQDLIPDQAGITQLFSREMSLASAWIHILVMDLFAARLVYLDGLQNCVETRHSVSLCLMSCPIGVISHFITKALSNKSNKENLRV